MRYSGKYSLSRILREATYGSNFTTGTRSKKEIIDLLTTAITEAQSSDPDAGFTEQEFNAAFEKYVVGDSVTAATKEIQGLIINLAATPKSEIGLGGDRGEALATWLTTTLNTNLPDVGGGGNFIFADAIEGLIKIGDIANDPSKAAIFSVKTSNADNPKPFSNSKIKIETIFQVIQGKAKKGDEAQIVADEIEKYFADKKMGDTTTIQMGAIGVYVLKNEDGDINGLACIMFGPTIVNIKKVQKSQSYVYGVQITGAPGSTDPTWEKGPSAKKKGIIASEKSCESVFGMGKAYVAQAPAALQTDIATEVFKRQQAAAGKMETIIQKAVTETNVQAIVDILEEMDPRQALIASREAAAVLNGVGERIGDSIKKQENNRLAFDDILTSEQVDELEILIQIKKHFAEILRADLGAENLTRSLQMLQVMQGITRQPALQKIQDVPLFKYLENVLEKSEEKIFAKTADDDLNKVPAQGKGFLDTKKILRKKIK